MWEWMHVCMKKVVCICELHASACVYMNVYKCAYLGACVYTHASNTADGRIFELEYCRWTHVHKQVGVGTEREKEGRRKSERERERETHAEHMRTYALMRARTRWRARVRDSIRILFCFLHVSLITNSIGSLRFSASIFYHKLHGVIITSSISFTRGPTQRGDP